MTFSKRILLPLLIAALVILPAPLALATTEFKIATISPDGTAWMRDLKRTLSLIEAQTEGRVKFRLYAGGVMGDDHAVMRKMRARQLHGGIFQTGGLERISKSVSLYNLPMFFRDFEEVSAVRKEIDPLLMEKLNEGGLEAFGLVGLGFANAMSSKSGTSIADARKLKVWSPQGDLGAVRLLEAFGIVPVQLSIVDVLAGLQTGLIDTVASPPTAAIFLQWHTQLDYILDLPFMYIYSVFAVDGKRFALLSEADQQLVRKSIQTLLSRIEVRNYDDHTKALTALEAQGLEVLTPSEEETAEWTAAAQGATTDWVEAGLLDANLVELLEKAVASYRESTAK